MLAVDVTAGVVTEDEAVGEWISTGAVLDSQQLAELDFAIEDARRRDSYTLGWVMAKLAETAARYHAGASWGSPWWNAADIFVETTRRLLHKNPHGRYLAEARTVVERQLAIMAERCGPSGPGRYQPGELQEYAETLKVAGGLLLGPYIEYAQYGAQSLDYWLSSEQLSFIASPAAYDTGRLVQMPKPADAMAEAKNHLERAATVGAGHVKGLSLALLAQCVFYHGLFSGEPVMVEELADLAALAILYLDPGKDPHVSARMVLFRERFGGASEDYPTVEDVVQRTLLPSPRTATEARLQLQTFLALAPALSSLSPQLLALLWQRVAALGENLDGYAKFAVCETLLHNFPESVVKCRGSVARTEELAASIVADDRLSREAKATSLIHLAVESPGIGEAMSLLQQSRELAPEISVRYFDCIDYAEATTALERGRRSEQSGHVAEALECYAMGAHATARLTRGWAWSEISHALLLHVVACLRVCEDTDALRVAMSAVSVAHAVVPQLPATFHEGRSGLYWSLGVLIERLMWKGEHLALPMTRYLHHRLFKGADFAYAVATPGPSTFDEPSERLMAKLRQLEVAEGPYVPGTEPLDLSSSLPSEVYDLAYASTDERPGTSVPRVRTNRLRRAIDRATSHQVMLTASERQDNPLVGFMMPRQEDLPEDMVLISLFLGERDVVTRSSGDSAGLRTTATWFTREEEGCWAVNTVEAGSAGTHHNPHTDQARHLHSVAPSVAALRQAVQANTFGRPATSRAKRLLGEWYARLGGPIGDLLPQWAKQGKRHLCFWPHGPLHYVPYAVLEHNGQPLADDWTVSTVPSDVVLYRSMSPPTKPRLLVVGADLERTTGDGGGLGRTHARTLAGSFPDSRLLDGPKATPARLLEEISWATHLHVAAHGSHDAEATWFQCLYLNGDGGANNDGRLLARDIVGCDLRNVSLVTLSACESAMGRVDLNDNLRGLPAAFMLAGVATVIGALWPVGPDVADHFFVRLYGELLRGATKLEAFRTAQKATRSAFPSYRDWAAFTFTGGL
ncbi:CHAT domain-containing protein [Streptomyces sp. NPDC002588]|uniref:CHAT domain-containing protein n=1 Tax=Streptomyces sp. NPDC002588 TaxID=3154419 RepID=UPI003318AA20